MADDLAWEKQFIEGERAFESENYIGAEQAFLAALTLAEQFDRGDPRLVETLDKLAQAYMRLGNYARTNEICLESLALSELAHGAAHAQMIPALEGLAQVFRNQNLWQEADGIFERLLAVRETCFGPVSLETAKGLVSKAQFHLYWYSGENDEKNPVPLYERALEIRENILGPDHADTLDVLFALASCADAAKDPERAEKLLQEMLLRRRRVLGPHHPDVAIALLQLIQLYESQNRYAESLYREIYACAQGPNPMEEAQILAKLALHFKHSPGKNKEALAMYQRVLNIMEKLLGPNDPALIESLLKIADLNYADKLYAQSGSLYQRAIDIEVQAFGEDRSDVVYYLSMLSTCCACQDLFEEAAGYNQRALGVARKVYGPVHEVVIQRLSDLGMDYYWLNDFAKSEATYKEAEALCVKLLDQKKGGLGVFMTVHGVLCGFINVYTKTGQIEAREAYEHKKELFGLGEPENLARLLEYYRQLE